MPSRRWLLARGGVNGVKPSPGGWIRFIGGWYVCSCDLSWQDQVAGWVGSCRLGALVARETHGCHCHKVLPQTPPPHSSPSIDDSQRQASGYLPHRHEATHETRLALSCQLNMGIGELINNICRHKQTRARISGPPWPASFNKPTRPILLL